MKVTPEHNERIAKMKFRSVYPHYITKIEKRQNHRRTTSSNNLAHGF